MNPCAASLDLHSEHLQSTVTQQPNQLTFVFPFFFLRFPLTCRRMISLTFPVPEHSQTDSVAWFAIWVWLKIQKPRDRRFWSTCSFARLPLWAPLSHTPFFVFCFGGSLVFLFILGGFDRWWRRPSAPKPTSRRPFGARFAFRGRSSARIGEKNGRIAQGEKGEACAVDQVFVSFCVCFGLSQVFD